MQIIWRILDKLDIFIEGEPWQQIRFIFVAVAILVLSILMIKEYMKEAWRKWNEIEENFKEDDDE